MGFQNIRKNKRGSARDVMLGAVMIFGFALLSVVMFATTNDIYDALLNQSIINDTNSSKQAIQDSQNLLTRLDYLVFMVFLGVLFSLIVTSFFVSAHPVFFFPFSLFLLITTVISGILSFVWDNILATTFFSGVQSSFPITNFILNNFPLLMTVFGIVTLVVLYAKIPKS
jgi:hypothetical protein